MLRLSFLAPRGENINKPLVNFGKTFLFQSCRFPANIPDSIQLGSEALARLNRTRCFLRTSLALVRIFCPEPDPMSQNLTQWARTWPSEPEPDPVSQNLTQWARTWPNEPEPDPVSQNLTQWARTWPNEPEPDPMSQNLTQWARTKSDPGWLCTTWSEPSMEEHNWVWTWESCSGPFSVALAEPDQTILAQWIAASGPDPFSQNLTRPSRSAGFAYNGQSFFGRTKQNRMQAWHRIRHRRSGLVLAARWLRWS